MFIEIEELEKTMHISEPWYVDRCKFNEELQQLDIFIKYRKHGLFTCSDCRTENQSVYDTADENRTWRHLNFWEFPTYIHAELPRTKCNHCNKILRVNVPWAVAMLKILKKFVLICHQPSSKDLRITFLTQLLHLTNSMSSKISMRPLMK